jgi:hypothetical protein
MSIFDDLIPQQKAGGTDPFADLVPSKPVAAAPVASTEDLTKPSFAMAKPFRKDTALKEVQAAAIEERNRPKFSWQEMTTNQDLQKVQREFLKIRGGVDTSSMSNEDVSKKFMEGMRRDEVNLFSQIASLNTLMNSNASDKVKLEEGKRIYEQTVSATEKGGQPGAAPYLDVARALLTDPSNYAGPIVAQVGKSFVKSAAKEALKKGVDVAAKSRIDKALTPTTGKVIAATTGVEAAIGAGADVASQKEQQELSRIRGEEPEAIDYTRTAAMSLLSGVFGAAEAKGTLAIKPGKPGKEEINTILQSKTIVPKDPNAPQTPAERMLTDKVTENMDTVVEEFMNIQGGRILDDINPATPLTDAKIQKELSARAVRVALHVMETDPTFRVKPGQKTSMAINEVFSNLDKIDDVVLEQAIRKEGLTPEEFAQANKLTVTEAAQVMQQYSAASKAMQRLTQIDPEFAKRAELLFGKPNDVAEAMGFWKQVVFQPLKAVQRVERESKAFIVSGIGTTVRNMFSTTGALTFNSAASLVEGVIYTAGRTTKAAFDPKSSAVDTFKKGMGDTIRDAFEVYGYLAKSDLSAEATDLLLQHNPAIRNQILSATQENGTAELSKAARLFNSLNVAQDAFFRRAIFTATVEKNMRKIGLDMYETLAKGQVIPADVLKDAADTTLKSTFSYTPKSKGFKTAEGSVETLGNLFVKAAEAPFMSLVTPFPRYMANAVAFQYRYSPLGGVIPAKDLAANIAKAANGDEVAIAAVQKANQDIAKSVVGTAMLYAAYEYRLANQDVEWGMYKNEDGTTTDTRPLGAWASYLAVADWMVKQKLDIQPDTKGITEQIIGMKLAGGTQGYFVDKLFNAFSEEKESTKLADEIGRVIGDFAGRFVQPFVFKSAYEFFDLFREEGAVARDPNVIKSEEFTDRLIESATNRVKSKLPVVKEQLPEAVVRLQEGPAYKEGEFFYSLIGVRDIPNKTPEEKEIKRLGIDPYRLYGPSSGDKEYDRTFVKEANPYVIEAIKQTIDRPDYQNLPIDEQKLKLTNIVRNALSIPKEIVAAKMTAEDFGKVQKMRFDKLPLEQRKIINRRYAEENNGVTLEEAKDYIAVDEYLAKAIEPLKFALGGFVGKIGAKKAAKTATGTMLEATTKAAPVSQQISDIVEKELKTTSPAIDQMSSILQGKPAAAPVKKAPAVKPKQPLAAQTEEALPAPTPKKEIAPVVKEEPAAPTASAFTDDDYALGEQNMIKNIGMDESALKSWKINNYDDYMNTVHAYTGMAKGVNYKDMPPSPFLKQMDEGADSFIDEVEYDIDGNPIGAADQTPTSVKKIIDEEDRAMYGIDEKYLSGDMNTVTGNSIGRRKAAVSAIKDYREDAFFKLRQNKAFKQFDDEVIGTILGDYRYSKGVELNPRNAADVAEATKMAKQYQVKLDELREKYKDMPPMKLFHGQGDNESIRGILSRGFRDPQKGTWAHSEMNVGAPSFTRDINLGMRGTPFGGTNPENYVVTEIPYADYVFSRINMSPEKYDKKDINSILRSVTGAPDVIRTVSLPRAGYLETEDMIVEAEKLRVKGASPKMRSAEKDVAQMKVPLRSEHKAMEEKLYETMRGALEAGDDKLAFRNAYKSYSQIRELMKSYLDMAKGVSVKKGLGQQYQAAINTFVESPMVQREMTKIAEILENGGAKQKATNLYLLREKLMQFGASEPEVGFSTATNEAKRTKPLEDVTKFIPKLAKGGLASRR